MHQNALIVDKAISIIVAAIFVAFKFHSSFRIYIKPITEGQRLEPRRPTVNVKNQNR